MKRILCLVFALVFSVGCQKMNPETLSSESENITGSVEPKETMTADTALPGVPGFYQGDADVSKTPHFHLWMEPSEDILIPLVQIDCNGRKTEVYSSPDGLEMENHCIVTTGDFRATVALPDLSSVLLDSQTVVQFNFDDAGTEIILQEGTLYTNVAEQAEGKHYLITVANMQIESVGTEFGVSVLNGLTTVIMGAGMVATYLCETWQNDICAAWEQTKEYIIPFASYSRNLSDEEWLKTEIEYNTMIAYERESPIDFLMNSQEYEGTFWVKAAMMADFFAQSRDSVMGDFTDEKAQNNAYEPLCKLTSKSVGNLSGSEAYYQYSIEELRNMANDKNEALASFYCEENPSSCFVPTAKPTLVVQLPDDSGSSSSGSSASACANVPANLLSQVYSCDCGNKSKYGVFCHADYGEGWYPENCIRSLNLCK